MNLALNNPQRFICNIIQTTNQRSRPPSFDSLSFLSYLFPPSFVFSLFSLSLIYFPLSQLTFPFFQSIRFITNLSIPLFLLPYFLQSFSLQYPQTLFPQYISILCFFSSFPPYFPFFLFLTLFFLPPFFITLNFGISFYSLSDSFPICRIK